MISEGQKLPAFKLQDDAGKTWTNADLKGKQTVLFIYPKDMTPGCTQEACDFRDNLNAVQQHGARVLGLSKLGPESKRKFKEKHGLNFPLLADPDQSFLRKLDVIQPKNMYGRQVEGIVRTTLIIDESGTVKKVFSPVKVSGHVAEVIDALSGKSTAGSARPAPKTRKKSAAKKVTTKAPAAKKAAGKKKSATKVTKKKVPVRKAKKKASKKSGKAARGKKKAR